MKIYRHKYYLWKHLYIKYEMNERLVKKEDELLIEKWYINIIYISDDIALSPYKEKIFDDDIVTDGTDKDIKLYNRIYKYIHI